MCCHIYTEGLYSGADSVSQLLSSGLELEICDMRIPIIFLQIIKIYLICYFFNCTWKPDLSLFFLIRKQPYCWGSSRSSRRGEATRLCWKEMSRAVKAGGSSTIKKRRESHRRMYRWTASQMAHAEQVTVLLSTSLAWPAWADCVWAELLSQHVSLPTLH